MRLKAFEDPEHLGNGRNHYTGKRCIVSGCGEPAGTAWGPHWCFRHNVERIKRIDKQMNDIERKLV